MFSGDVMLEWFGPGDERRELDAPPELTPVFLGDDIISKAKEWRHACLASWEWGQPRTLFPIGDAVLTSPVDLQERQVTLCLAPWSNDPFGQKAARGVTFTPGTDFSQGAVDPDPVRYRVLLNTFYPPGGDLLHVILHELTHVVDPCFLEDCQLRKADPGRWGPAEQYGLPSERRAFVSMWIEDLREAIAAGTYRDPESFASRLANRCPEFDGFYVGLYARGPKRTQQIREHIAALAAHLGWTPSLGEPTAS
jgi:hypothetical protein